MITIFGFIAVVVIVFIIAIILMQGHKARKPLFSSSLSKWIILIYSAILVISGIILYALPISSATKQLEDTDDTGMYAEVIVNNFGNIVESGELEGHKGIYKNQSYKFDYSGNEISLSALNTKDGFYDIWIEKKETDDGTIEADNYLTKEGVLSECITEKMQPPSILLIGNTLSFFPVVSNRIDCIGFNDDFTSAQFSYGAANRFGKPWLFLRDIIHLRIPKSMKVGECEGSLNINYIN